MNSQPAIRQPIAPGQIDRMIEESLARIAAMSYQDRVSHVTTAIRIAINTFKKG